MADEAPAGWTAEEWADWHDVVCPPVEERLVEAVTECHPGPVADIIRTAEGIADAYRERYVGPRAGLTEATEAYEAGDVLGETPGFIIIDDPIPHQPVGRWFNTAHSWAEMGAAADRAGEAVTGFALVADRVPRSWGLADAPLWAKIIGYSFVAVLSIVGGLALGILILFLVAVLQALVDVVVH